MSDIKSSHPALQKEHQFNREIKTDFIPILNERRKGEQSCKIAEAEEEKYQKAWRRGEKEGRRKSREKYRNKKIGHFAVALLSILALFVYKFFDKNEIIEGFSGIWFTGGVGGLVGALLGGILSERKNKHKTETGDDIWGAMGKFLLDSVKSIRKNVIHLLLFVLAVVMLTGGIGAEVSIDVHVVNAVKMFFQGISSGNSESINKDSEDKENLTKNEQINDKESESGKEIEHNEKRVNPETALQIISEYDDEFLVKVENTEITSVERNMSKKLSADDKNMVFFLGGDYYIDDWNNQEKINEIVKNMVKTEHSENLINIFDKDALESVRGRTDNASEKEKSADSFSEVENIIKIRKDIYSDYPKKSFPNLISGGYQRLALILIGNGGKQNTILYFYGQSILWDFEYLRYEDVSNDLLKDRLNRIAARYKDIADICVDCEEAEYARKLQVAFEETRNSIEGE